MPHTVSTSGGTISRTRIIDFLALTKPELTLMSVFTAVGSAHLASAEHPSYSIIAAVFWGTMSVGSSAGILNQYLERKHDALMKRTDRRPLPAGTIQPQEALLFGVAAAIAGAAILLVFTTLFAAFLSLLTLFSYLFVYTPLKRRTPFATVIGGIPGALPPLIGWTAVGGHVTPGAWALFFILFFWQMPHFLSLAWIYRNDYARAGFRLLTVIDPTGVVTGRQSVVYCIALVPAAVLPTLVGLAGMYYFVGAILLAAGLLAAAIRFIRVRSNNNARQLFLASLAFLPLIYGLLIIDRI